MALSDIALVTLIQAKAYLRVDASASLRIDAEYVGTGNAVNATFALDYVSIEGSLKLYVDNELQVETDDYTIVLSTKTITFVAASIPGAGKIVTASYDKASSDNTFEGYDDDLLETLINAATKKAEDHTGRAFIQREITETHIGDSRQFLELYKRPVVDISSVTIDDEVTDYAERLSIGRIYHTDVWPEDYEIVVVYQAGYAATRAATQALIPDAVVAVLGAVAVWYENRMGIKSQNIAGVGSIDYGDLEGLPEASKKKLESLRVNTLL